MAGSICLGGALGAMGSSSPKPCLSLEPPGEAKKPAGRSPERQDWSSFHHCLMEVSYRALGCCGHKSSR
jgi:hypothetical protein